MAGDRVAVIKVRMHCRTEFNCSRVLKPQRNIAVVANLFDGSHFPG
jgi:hypothetical protein